MTKKAPKSELADLYDRESMNPCKTCYKRDSCFTMPRNGNCVSYEAGTPWSVEYARMEDLNRIPAFHEVREQD